MKTNSNNSQYESAVNSASVPPDEHPSSNNNRDNSQSHGFPPPTVDGQRYYDESAQHLYSLGAKHPGMEINRVQGAEYYYPREDYRQHDSMAPQPGEYYPHPIPPRNLVDHNPPSVGVTHYEINRIPDETSSNAFPPSVNHAPHDRFAQLGPSTPGRYHLYPPPHPINYPSPWHTNPSHQRVHSYPPHIHDPNVNPNYYESIGTDIEPAPLATGHEDTGYMYRYDTGYPQAPNPYTPVVPAINTQPSPQRSGNNPSPGPKSESNYVSPTHSDIDVNALKRDDLGDDDVNTRKRRLENSPRSADSNHDRNTKRTLSDRKQLQSQAWYDRFQELSEYKEKHGDCMVPQKYAPNPSLGIWVNKQRMEYKLLQDGEKSSMTPERLSALRSIGFVWAKRKGQATWDAKFKQLQEYKAIHGDCLIPTKYSKDPALGRWVSTQREQYRLWKSGDARSKMTETKIHLLESVGFVWRLQF